MAETTDAYQSRRRLLLEVSRALAPARRSADVDAFLVVVGLLPETEGQLAATTRALHVAEPLLGRAIGGEFDRLRGTPMASLVELRDAVARELARA